jgi:asparagine synthase (glutamine-hydrolysing)
MIGAAFFAIVDPTRRAASEAAADRPTNLRLVFENPLLAIYADRSMPTTVLGSNGIALGSVFHKGSAAPVEALDNAAPATLARTLIDRCWGDYVALIADPAQSSVHVLRSPSGGVHAFRTRRGPIAYLASDIDLLRMGAARLEVDWAFVAHHLAFSHLHTGDTGIAGIDEVMPGDCAVEQGSRHDRVNLWSPWYFVRSGGALPFDDAARTVHAAVLQAVEALVAPSDKLALELSGGLDSSIVAAALAATGRHAVAVNLSTPGPEGDERHYARAVAEHCRIPLVETLVDGEIDLTESAASIEPRPGMLAMLRLADRQFAAIGEEQEVTGFINGTGGDCVFCSLGTVAPAADRLHAGNMGLGLLRSIRDVAEVHNANLWKVAGLALRKGRRRRPDPIWRRNSYFLRTDRLPAEPTDHPWLVEPANALGGTRAHIHAILASYSHLDGYGRQHVARSIFPLLSQPVVETCVAIPSWLWVAGGRDRAVARAAFRGLLPDITLDRRTKGGMEAFCARTFEINRNRLSSFLLDGHLAAAGLLDVSAIEAYLARPFANRDTLFYHLLPIVDTERWVRGVVSSAPDPAPAMARQR